MPIEGRCLWSLAPEDLCVWPASTHKAKKHSLWGYTASMILHLAELPFNAVKRNISEWWGKFWAAPWFTLQVSATTSGWSQKAGNLELNPGLAHGRGKNNCLSRICRLLGSAVPGAKAKNQLEYDSSVFIHFSATQDNLIFAQMGLP